MLIMSVGIFIIKVVTDTSSSCKIVLWVMYIRQEFLTFFMQVIWKELW